MPSTTPSTGAAGADRESAPELRPLDPEALLTQCMGRADLAKRVVAKFVDQAGIDLAAIDAAVEAGDASALAFLAHRIKGGAGILTAEAIRGTAERLERIGFAGELAGAEALVSELRDGIETFRAAASRVL